MYKLYVIPGSHACRSGMLMLEHKRAPYRRVDVVTLTHPMVVRLHGFDAGGETRVAGDRRTLPLRLGDLLGTVPALADGKARISTNHAIARYLDQRHPDQPLLPADPEQRSAVEQAERWANDTLQMAARRIVFSAVLRDPAAMTRATDDGRMGYLLYRSYLIRRLITPWIGRLSFAARQGEDRQLLADLSAMLDRIDAWVDRGVLNGPELNVADFMVAPSLALILYRPDVRPIFEGRPALELVDRLLPEQTRGVTPAAGNGADLE
jgi:glutathione S-transferase